MLLSDRQRRIGLAGGALCLTGFAGFIGAAVAALLRIPGTEGLLAVVTDPVVLSVLRFTLLQAVLSVLLSLAFAIPVALALARRSAFPGRVWIVRLMALPMGLPVLIGAIGLVGIWGRNGLLNDVLAAAGAERFSIYGLAGILIAHVFFNMPLAVRLLLSGLERITPEYWLISANLGMGPLSIFRFVEWPVLRRLLPGIAGLIFMLCATSFTLVLMLGGGPGATTLEVAIYQALRFDFDPPRAVALALMQIAVTVLILSAMAAFPAAEASGIGQGRARKRFDGQGTAAWITDVLLIGFAGLFLALPLGQVVIAGLRSDLGRIVADPAVWRAAGTSLVIAGGCGLITVLAAFAIIRAREAAGEVRSFVFAARGFSALLGGLSALVLLVPAMVIATGWFILLRGLGSSGSFAPTIVAGINVMMALPFVMRVVEPASVTHRHRTARLAASLGISGLAAFRRVDWPILRRPLMTGFSFAAALSLGDLGAVALFGSENLTTLPWLIYQRLGNYRSHDADGLALMLGLVCLGLTVFGTAGDRQKVEVR